MGCGSEARTEIEDRQRNRERHTETETESFTAVFCCDCTAVFPSLLLAILAIEQTLVALEDINLSVIYALLQCDWLDYNL